MAVDRSLLIAAQRHFHGEILEPRDDGYDEHRRVWNGSIDRNPALIMRCAEDEDVATAVRLGREAALPTAVRGGGHSFPGLSTCDDGLVVDLALMRSVTVDRHRQTVRVQAGALLGDLDRATQAHGMAVPSGIVTHTGVAGLTLGGGVGWLQRKHGLTIDNLRSMRIVTADGTAILASAEQHPELFWGLRGGGGNFGVVTEFDFEMHPVGPHVLAGPIFWRADETRQLLYAYREWLHDCPPELMTMVVQRRLANDPFVPPDLVGELVVGVVICWSGSLQTGETFVAPLRSFGAPVLDRCRPTPFLAHQRMFDASFPHGHWYYFRSCDVPELDDDVIDVMLEQGERITSPMSSVALWQMGGAISSVDPGATAYGNRNAGFVFNINGSTPSPRGFEAEREWVRSYAEALEHHRQGVYVNFLMDEGEDRIRDAFGAQNYERLQTLKRDYDPHNVFRLNQNILPA